MVIGVPSMRILKVFINDKANARIAVIRLEDMITTQIVHSGLLVSNHGGTFVTPNTE